MFSAAGIVKPGERLRVTRMLMPRQKERVQQRVHFQNLTEFTQYLEAIQRGDLPVSRAMTTTEEERMIRELILQLKLGRVSRSYFAEKFRVNIAERFHQEFEDLRLKGLLSEQGDWFVLSRDALLKVDTLLHAFFLPRHKHARYT